MARFSGVRIEENWLRCWDQPNSVTSTFRGTMLLGMEGFAQSLIHDRVSSARQSQLV
jgi:hypothetical protein